MASATAQTKSAGRFTRTFICYLLPTGVLPLPADILQGFCRLPVQLRCPYRFPSAVCHISERVSTAAKQSAAALKHTSAWSSRPSANDARPITI